MFKYTKHTLKKIEDLFKEFQYIIRYEKGNFQSGYCIVENRNIAVINRFYDTEARINCLLEILGKVELDASNLSEKGEEFYGKLQKVIATKDVATAETSESDTGETKATETETTAVKPEEEDRAEEVAEPTNQEKEETEKVED